MPNWVKLKMTVTGAEHIVHHFLTTVTTRKDGIRQLDFARVIRPPKIYTYYYIGTGAEHDLVHVYLAHESLSDNPSKKFPSFCHSGLKYLGCDFSDLPTLQEQYKRVVAKLLDLRDFDDRNTRVFVDEKQLVEYGKELIGAYRRYGTNDWYQWNCKYWGTKWNAVTDMISIKYIHESDQDMQCEITFNTAWCAPTPIFDKYAELFPELKFEIYWADEDVGVNTGYVEYINGKQTLYIENENCSKQAYDTAIRLWELWDYWEFDPEQDNWVPIDPDEED